MTSTPSTVVEVTYPPALVRSPDPYAVSLVRHIEQRLAFTRIHAIAQNMLRDEKKKLLKSDKRLAQLESIIKTVEELNYGIR